MVQLTATSISGPLPSPELLAGYEQVVPGSAERIMAMAERQAKHRQDCETLKIKATITDAAAERAEAQRGQFFALIITVFALTMSGAIVFLVPNGFGSTVASIIGGTTVSGLAIAFIIGRKSSHKANSAAKEPAPPK